MSDVLCYCKIYLSLCLFLKQGVFKNFDKDGSGNFDAYELKLALRKVGKFMLIYEYHITLKINGNPKCLGC